MFCPYTDVQKDMEAPPAPVISTEYDVEEDEQSDDENIPDPPMPPVISKQEVLFIKVYISYHQAK